jgi:hypothetical protein
MSLILIKYFKLFKEFIFLTVSSKLTFLYILFSYQILIFDSHLYSEILNIRLTK